MTDHVTVPREPTPAMLEAGEAAFENGYVAEMWAAMLAAAPAAQTVNQRLLEALQAALNAMVCDPESAPLDATSAR